jgi:hypothetical protein
MRRTFTIGLGVAAGIAAAMLALRGRVPALSSDPAEVGEPSAVARRDREQAAPPILEAAPSAASPERPSEALLLAAAPRSEVSPEFSPPSVADRSDERVLGAWMTQDDAFAHSGLTPPQRTYRGFTPTIPTMATGLMLCDLHADWVTINPDPPEGPCAADTELMEHIARGADTATGLWAPNTENLLRDFFEEHGPLTVEQVICGDNGCIVDGLAPSIRQVPLDESLAADFQAITKLRAEPWYRLYFEGGGGRTIHPGDIPAARWERVIVLKRRTTP